MRILACLSILIAFTRVHSQELHLQPADLNPGEQYRLFFTTSQTRDGTSSDIGDYNAFVQQVADDAPTVGSWGLDWSVLGSTAEVDARTNTNTNGIGVPIYLLDGVQLVPDYRGLWNPADFEVNVDGGLTLTELGTRLEGDVIVFTGTRLYGDGAPDDLLGSASPRVGTASSATNFDWFSVGLGGKSFEETPFYAISNTLTAVPEPSSQAVVLIGVFLVLLCRPNSSSGRSG